MFFTFPEDAHWNAERQGVAFRVGRLASTAALSGPEAGLPAAAPGAADP